MVSDPDNVRTPASASNAPDPNAPATPLLGAEEVREHTREPVDLTVDSEIDHARTLPYDPTIAERTAPAQVQVDAATWGDLRSLPVAPPSPTATGKDVKVYVCIQHPNMLVFDTDGETVVSRFENGYLATDNAHLQKLLEGPSQQYIKRLDYSKVAG